VIDPGLGHAPQQVLGVGGLGGLIGTPWVVREAEVVLPGEAVEVGVDHGGSVGGFSPEMARRERDGGGLEELASSHGRPSLVSRSRLGDHTSGIRLRIAHRRVLGTGAGEEDREFGLLEWLDL
jgi:hypothetical protein